MSDSQPAHLDAEKAHGVLEWCKANGGLDMYGWGDLISRLQDCVVPMPPDAPAKVAEAYRQGYRDATTYRPPAIRGDEDAVQQTFDLDIEGAV